MIRHLHIQNYAIIEKVTITFSNGLTTITGETGAGKSIIMGAMGLILGDRADTSVLYNEEEKCIVEGVFDISNYELKSYFQEHELDYDPELIIRREIRTNGKSRAFINDTPTTLSVLKGLSNNIIDLHRQFDTLDINQFSFQLNTLDALAEQKKKVLEYKNLYDTFKSTREELDYLKKKQHQNKKEEDFIRFQLEEIEKLELEKDEQQELERELEELEHVEELKEALQQTTQVFEQGEYAISDLISELLNLFRKAGSSANELRDRIESVKIEIDDISREAELLSEDVEWDPSRHEELQNRLDKIYKLQKKHDVDTVNELLELQESMQLQLEEFSHSDERINELQTTIDQLEKEAWRLAKNISKERSKVIEGFEQKVKSLLQEVAMPEAIFRVEIKQNEKLGNSGIDDVDFLFSANKGGKPAAVNKIASGGELSRLALCIKSIVAAAIPLPTMIFDEIDTGVSGDVALKMGRILQKLSLEHQIIVITHSPQISAQGDKHYLVYKESDQERTYTRVREIEGEQRVQSIARMLSSDPPTSAALENAKELLSLKQEIKK